MRLEFGTIQYENHSGKVLYVKDYNPYDFQNPNLLPQKGDVVRIDFENKIVTQREFNPHKNIWTIVLN